MNLQASVDVTGSLSGKINQNGLDIVGSINTTDCLIISGSIGIGDSNED